MSLFSTIKKITYSSCLVGTMYNSTLNATTLRDAIEHTINVNPDIMSEHYNKKSNREAINEKKGGYSPSLKLKVTAVLKVPIVV